MKKQLNYTSFQSPHYFDQLFIFFLIICFIFTLAIVDSSKGINAFYITKYIIIFFFIISIAVLYEMKNKSEYFTPMQTIAIRQFFNEFNHTIDKTQFIHKYNSKTQKKLKKITKKNIKYQLTNIIKRTNQYELHISQKTTNDKLYLLKFLTKQNNHILHIKEENNEFKIIKID